MTIKNITGTTQTMLAVEKSNACDQVVLPKQYVSISVKMPTLDFSVLESLSKQSGHSKERLMGKFFADGAELFGRVLIEKNYDCKQSGKYDLDQDRDKGNAEFIARHLNNQKQMKEDAEFILREMEKLEKRTSGSVIPEQGKTAKRKLRLLAERFEIEM